MALSAFVKSVLGVGVLTAGITATTVVWKGDEAVTNIKGQVDEMKGELAAAIEDNEFLKTQYTNLKGLYTSGMETAQALLNTAKTEAVQLRDEIVRLRGELDQSPTDAEAEQIQAEITRLEGELDAANMAILDLQTYVSEANAQQSYEAIDRSEYTMEEITVDGGSIGDGIPAPPIETPPTEDEPTQEEPTPPSDGSSVVNGVKISAEALAFNKTSAEAMANNKASLEAVFDRGETALYSDSLKVTTRIIGVEVVRSDSGSQKLLYKIDQPRIKFTKSLNYNDKELLKVYDINAVSKFFYVDINGNKQQELY